MHAKLDTRSTLLVFANFNANIGNLPTYVNVSPPSNLLALLERGVFALPGDYETMLLHHESAESMLPQFNADIWNP